MTDDDTAVKSSSKKKPDRESDNLVLDEQYSTRNSSSNNYNNSHQRSWTGISLPEDDDFDHDDAELSLVLNEWAGGTSVHGAASIADFMTWRRWKRVLWAVLVCSSGAIMVWQITQLIIRYREYKVDTSTETIVPPSLEFPEISVCNYATKSLTRMNLTGIQHPKNLEELQKISQPLEEFITRTIFNGKELDSLSVWKPMLTSRGFCYSFHTNETVLRAGYSRDSGLIIDFYLNQEDYPENDISGDGDLAGVQVWAEMPGTPINDQIPYFAAPPGKVTVASLRKVHFQRETETPWAKCFGSAPQHTQANCRAKCVNKALQRECECKYDYGNPDEPNLRFCITQQDRNCIQSFFAGDGVEALKNCPDCASPPCEETRYEPQTTFYEFSDHLLKKITEQYNETEDFWRKNVVVVDINFNRIEYIEVAESKSVEIYTLLGSIGGSMGLFLGISVISVVEVFGDLGAMRLLPRLFGHRNLHGLGARKSR